MHEKPLMVLGNVIEAGQVLQSVWPGRTFWEQVFLGGSCLTLHFSRFLQKELEKRPWGALLPVIHSCSSGMCVERNFPVLCNQPVWLNPQNPEAVIDDDQLNNPHKLTHSLAAVCSWAMSTLPLAVPFQTPKRFPHC